MILKAEVDCEKTAARSTQDDQSNWDTTTPCRRPLRHVAKQLVGGALSKSGSRRRFVSTLMYLALLCQTLNVFADDNEDNYDYYYSASAKRNWLYGSNSVGLEYVGCVWGYIEGGEDGAEDMACRENESEDGTTYWYQMANCRRAQVAYNVYASDSKSISCSSNTFKESLVTKNGLDEFIYTMNSYDENSPLSNLGDDDLPVCEEDGDGYYISVGCTSSGTFALNRFSDEYCLNYYDQYDSLDDINSAMKKLQSCHSCYSSSSDQNVYQTSCAYMIPYSQSCMSVDSPLCTDTDDFVSAASGNAKRKSHNSSLGAGWANKAKYVFGSFLLVASVVMFMGILFTNRRRRRAMMHRKFRQSASRSKHRSKSRNRSSSRARRPAESGSGGVFT